ncbi:hypothetical protein [Thermofilum pendens]|uniref:hypothetical protein n=1 Tax=Thermofilum pendens TaxID=2269 RepID=UPI0000DCA5DF|nr:hypothetical protein [Thermofilum pendens]
MRGTSLVARRDVPGFLKALTAKLLGTWLSRLLVLLLLAASLVGVLTGCYSCIANVAEIVLAFFAYAYVHEVAQFLFIDSDVEVAYEDGALTLRAVGEPRWPRLAVACGIVAPGVLGAAALGSFPAFGLVVLLLTLITLLRYLADEVE